MISAITWSLAGIIAVSFIIFFIQEPRRLRNGVLPVVAIAMVLIALNYSEGEEAQQIGSVLFSIVLWSLLLCYLAMIPFLVINGIIVLRREGRSLALLMPLALGMILIVPPIYVFWSLQQYGKHISILIPFLMVTTICVTGYLGLFYLCFMLFGTLYRISTHNAQGDVVLILGSKIFDGKAPPLLASRLDRAIQVFKTAKQDGQDLPILICCGGQGADETRPESAAMADYLLENGIPQDFIRQDDQSTTTKENILFGSKIATEIRSNPHLLIATNEYHTFRTALLSRKLNVPAQVVAAKTARYYLPAALLREFIAVLRDYLKYHVVAALVFAGFLGLLLYESMRGIYF